MKCARPGCHVTFEAPTGAGSHKRFCDAACKRFVDQQIRWTGASIEDAKSSLAFYRSAYYTGTRPREEHIAHWEAEKEQRELELLALLKDTA